MSGKPKHGLSLTPEYRAWQQMRLRCLDPKHAAYQRYGGRGITICERWLNDVAAFYADMGPRPSPDHELDRRDNNGPYSPDNCRWVTRTASSRNRGSNRLLCYCGVTLPLVEWCERLKLPSDTIRKRLEAGWTVAEALNRPVRPKAPNGSDRKFAEELAEVAA